MHVEYGEGHKGRIRIPAALVIKNRNLWNKTVYFVIGFSWMTPKAFDITPVDPTDDPVVFVVGQADIFPPELPEMHTKQILTQVTYWTKIAYIDKELHEIARIRKKMRQKGYKASPKEVILLSPNHGFQMDVFLLSGTDNFVASRSGPACLVVLPINIGRFTPDENLGFRPELTKRIAIEMCVNSSIQLVLRIPFWKSTNGGINRQRSSLGRVMKTVSSLVFKFRWNLIISRCSMGS